jgi:hypothetical protein
VPPAPEQDKEYVLAPVVDGVTVSLPFVAFVPDQSPEAAQLVAFALDQLIVTDCPMIIDDGEADMETVGLGRGEVPPPPPPPQAERKKLLARANIKNSFALISFFLEPGCSQSFSDYEINLLSRPVPHSRPNLKSWRWASQ